MSDAYSTAVLADSPVAYYRLDEASGNFADSSGNSRTATASVSGSFTYNQTSLLSQISNASCAHISGYNNADRATAATTLNPQSTDISIEAWLSWPSDGGTIMHWATWQGSGGGGVTLSKLNSTNVIEVVLLGVVAFDFTTTLAANTTYHTVFTYYSDGGGNPPGSGTSNLNTSAPACYIAFAPINATGISFQKQATSGSTIGTFFFAGSGSSPFTQSQNGFRYQTALGLADTSVGGPAYTGAPFDLTYAAGARIAPVLAMTNLGFNDLTGTGGTELAMWTEYVKKFAGACQDAHCDGIILSGQLPYNSNWPTYGPDRFNTLKNTAYSYGLGFVDLFYPIGGPSLNYTGPGTNPHLTKPQYQAQADFLWDNLLAVI